MERNAHDIDMCIPIRLDTSSSDRSASAPPQKQNRQSTADTPSSNKVVSCSISSAPFPWFNRNHAYRWFNRRGYRKGRQNGGVSQVD